MFVYNSGTLTNGGQILPLKRTANAVIEFIRVYEMVILMAVKEALKCDIN